jgi:hypothetical protein
MPRRAVVSLEPEASWPSTMPVEALQVPLVAKDPKKSYEIDPILDRRRDRESGDLEPEPTVEFEGNHVLRPITIPKACVLVWNFTGILPSLAVRLLVRRCGIQTPDLCGCWHRNARNDQSSAVTKDMPPVEEIGGFALSPMR